MNAPIVFDIETHSARELGAMDPDDFFRIGGVSTWEPGSTPWVTDTRKDVTHAIETAPIVSGHNIMAFDLPALGYSPVDIMRMARARKILDTWVFGPLIDMAPDKSVGYQASDGSHRFPKKPEQLMHYYRLDEMSFRYGGARKTAVLSNLAKDLGLDANGKPLNGCCSFGSVPTDHPDFRGYLSGDVVAARDVLAWLVARLPNGIPDYYWIEHERHALTTAITQNGFRLDWDLAQERYAQGEDQKEVAFAWLEERYGLPLFDSKGVRRSSPTTSKEGKAALSAALLECGVSDYELPRTANKAPSFSKEGFEQLAAKYPDNGPLQELCDAMIKIRTVRTIYQTALDTMSPDGFAHLPVNMLQRSGRASFGLTVFGKRGGKHRERDVYIPDVTFAEGGPEDAHVIFTVDLAQIDARMVAVHSQDHGYMDLFLPGRDSHTEVAKQIFGDLYHTDPYAYRERAKVFGHGYNYSLGERSMVENHGADPVLAHQFYEGMRRRFPRLTEWQERVRAYAESTGMIGNGWGRTMKVDRERAYTQAPALVGQGGARDAIFHGALKFDDAVIPMIKGMVHDEFVFSAPIKVARDVRAHVLDCLTFQWAPEGASRPIDVVADCSPFAASWGACYDKP